MEKLWKYLDCQGEAMRDTLVQLACLESPSNDKAGVDRVAAYIKDFCDKAGMETTLIPCEATGNSFSAVMNPDSQKEAIVLMGHMDTVHPVGAFGASPVKIINDMIYGPGVYDCKGGLVIAMYVCKALMKWGYTDRPIRLLFSGDEEVGHKDNPKGKEIYLQLRGKVAAALNCESGLMDGRIVTGRKGGAGMKMVITGVAAHSGVAPEKGRSAIREAAHKIIEIEKHTDFSGTTFNCGTISGGKVLNQIPDYCEIGINMRAADLHAYEEGLALLRQIAGYTFIEGTATRLLPPARTFLPMDNNSKNQQLFALYRQACRQLQIAEPCPFVAGGGSDASLTVSVGIPTICAVGIRGENNHTLQERALLSSMPERAKILSTLILNFPDKVER